jgi:hypothetical protein
MSKDGILKIMCCLRFEVFMTVTMKNAIFWDVMPCGSCGFYKNHMA